MTFIDNVSSFFGGRGTQDIKYTENTKAEHSDFADVAVDHMVGRRHEAYYRPCEDYSGYRIFNGKATMALSDGCSSVEEAEAAAKISVDSALRFLQDTDWTEISDVDVLNEFIDALQKQLRDSKKEYAELSATLLAVSVNRDTNEYIIISIGDGYAYAYDESYLSSMIVEPFNIDGDPNSTCFGNDIDVKELAQIKRGNFVEDGYQGFAVFTDGASAFEKDTDFGVNSLRDLAYAARNQDRKFLHNMVANIQAERTNDDVAIGIMMLTPYDYAMDEPQETEGAFQRPNLDEVSAEFAEIGYPEQYGALILNAFWNDKELSMEDLIEKGICQKGSVLRTLLPLVRGGFLAFENDKFVLIEKTGEY